MIDATLALGFPSRVEWIIIVAAAVFYVWFHYTWAAEQARVRAKQRGFAVEPPDDADKTK